MFVNDLSSNESVFVANHNQTGKLIQAGDSVLDTSGEKRAIFVKAERRKIFIRYENSDEVLCVTPGRFSIILREKRPSKLPSAA